MDTFGPISAPAQVSSYYYIRLKNAPCYYYHKICGDYFWVSSLTGAYLFTLSEVQEILAHTPEAESVIC